MERRNVASELAHPGSGSATGILGDTLHLNGPISEGELFDRVQLKPGQETMVCGAFSFIGALKIPSRMAKETEDELKVYYHDLHGTSGVAIARRGSAEMFASALSLTW